MRHHTLEPTKTNPLKTQRGHSLDSPLFGAQKEKTWLAFLTFLAFGPEAKSLLFGFMAILAHNSGLPWAGEDQITVGGN